MNRHKLATLLEEIALYYELLGENPFKIRAHQNGARVIEKNEDLDAHLKNDTLSEIKGIGPGLQQKIKEFAATGELTEHRDLKAKVPQGLIDLVSVPGLGPKKARTIFEKLDVKSIGELEYACRENRLAKLSGFGEKTQGKILKSLEFVKKHQNSFLYSDASLEAQLLISFLKKQPGVQLIETVGGIRRRLETVKGIGVLLGLAPFSGESVEQVFQGLSKFPGFVSGNSEKAAALGEIRFSLESGIPVKIKIVPVAGFFAELIKLTGSEKHLEELKNYVSSKNLVFETFLTSKNFRSEEEIYSHLDLQFIAPELREGRGEIVDAAAKRLPELVEQKEIKGIFHCHTTESDGSNTLEEMVAAAQQLGFEYIGISDHSVSSLAYANGLKKERLVDQFEKIESLQKKFKIRIYKGIESDILTDGSLDYDDVFLKKFDFVIGSIHSGFTQKRELMTARVLKAISNPYLDFIGHPTGRLLLARDGFDIDMEAVITKATEVGAAIEINASPQRLDMDWRLGAFLRSKGGCVSINPDAHSVAGLEDVEFGVGVARKAGLSPHHVLNTLPASLILGRLRRARAHA